MRPQVSLPVGPAYWLMAWRLWEQVWLCPAEHQVVCPCLKKKKKKKYNHQALVCWVWNQPGALLRQHFYIQRQHGFWILEHLFYHNNVDVPFICITTFDAYALNIIRGTSASIIVQNNPRSRLCVASCSAFLIIVKCHFWKLWILIPVSFVFHHVLSSSVLRWLNTVSCALDEQE